MKRVSAEVTEHASGGWVRARGLLCRPVPAAVVVLALYVALSFLSSPRGFLGTDTGGKVATVKVMSERGDFDPDVGYWAAEWDPDATVHGLYYTSRVGDRYVNVTSLPMVIAARPLYDVGGYRAMLLLPMLGSLAAAFGARAIARRVADTDGWPAFWVAGLASPLLIYALDFWEHSIGVALLVWGAVVLHDAVRRSPRWWRGLLAGAAFGAAFSLRTESLVYGFVMVLVACVALVVISRALLGALIVGLTAAVGFGALVLANAGLEIAALGTTFRSGRAGGAASAGGSDLALRLKEAIVTSLSPVPSVDTSAFVLGLALVVTLAYLVWSSSRRRDRTITVALACLVGFLYLYRFSTGLGFVPGLVAATPLAVVGVVLGWSRKSSRLFVVFALAPLPLVFLFQFPGGAAPQWAGRYILTSGTILLALGVAALPRVELWLRRYLVVVSLLVTAFGLSWLVVRSHDVARAADVLEARPETVLISPNGFVPREFGATYGRKEWLASGNPEDLQFAARVAADSGAPSFALVALGHPTPPSFPGWTEGSSETVPFLAGTDFQVTTYTRADTQQE